jgi:hypothetical protein
MGMVKFLPHGDGDGDGEALSDREFPIDISSPLALWLFGCLLESSHVPIVIFSWRISFMFILHLNPSFQLF